jgi:hypothetical protein
VKHSQHHDSLCNIHTKTFETFTYNVRNSGTLSLQHAKIRKNGKSIGEEHISLIPAAAPSRAAHHRARHSGRAVASRSSSATRRCFRHLPTGAPPRAGAAMGSAAGPMATGGSLHRRVARGARERVRAALRRRTSGGWWAED